jgi:group I intron endonuclease
MKSGIYRIVNKVNGKFYIGSSVDITKRWYSHLSHLQRNIHANTHLQHAFNKYGRNNIELNIIFLTTNVDEMLNEEQRLIDENIGKDICYNMNGGVTDLTGSKNPFYGKHHSGETKQKLSDGQKQKYSNGWTPRDGKLHSEESKEKMKKKKIGKYDGELHPRFDNSIYTFKNKNSGDVFVGTRYDFYQKYNLHDGNVSRMISGAYKSVKKWVLVQQNAPEKPGAMFM